LKAYDIGTEDYDGDQLPISIFIALVIVLLGLIAKATALILRAYWDHFVQVLQFDFKW
jgi:hypothetical protein